MPKQGSQQDRGSQFSASSGAPRSPAGRAQKLHKKQMETMAFLQFRFVWFYFPFISRWPVYEPSLRQSYKNPFIIREFQDKL